MRDRFEELSEEEQDLFSGVIGIEELDEYDLIRVYADFECQDTRYPAEEDVYTHTIVAILNDEEYEEGEIEDILNDLHELNFGDYHNKISGPDNIEIEEDAGTPKYARQIVIGGEPYFIER